MKVFIIVPVFSNVDLTSKMLLSLGDRSDIDIILVDDNPLLLHEILAIKFNLKYVKGNGSNYWGGSINLGLQEVFKNNPSGEDYIILMNNDVILQYSIFEFIKAADGRIAHPRCIDSNTKKWHKSCGELISWFPLIIDYKGPEIVEKEPTIDILTARFLLLPVCQICELRIDKNLPQYFGDVDLGLRLKKYGSKMVLLNEFTLEIDNSQTGLVRSGDMKSFYRILFDLKSTYHLKSRWYFIRNHNSLIFSFLVMFGVYSRLMFLFILNKLK